MTTQDKLGLRWANTGGVTDPGDNKYTTGWIVEIPTFQNFNYVLQVLDGNILAHAEEGEWFWEDSIQYQPGAQVKGSDDIFYRCHTASFTGSTTGADPVADTAGNYWTKGQVFGVSGDDVSTVDGIKLKGVVPSSSVTWEGTDLTIENGAPMMAFNTTGATDNWLLGNISGDLVVVSTGTVVTSADGRAMGTAEPNTYKLFHEGNPPTQSQIPNTIPANPVDGAIYARKDLLWVPVTSTTVSAAPPPPSIGAGQNWYNLSDGQTYTDINDGNSSQWVPTMAPVIADGSDGADGVDGLDGQDGVDGQDGINGVDGLQGAKGDTGDAGADGTNGTNGTDGIDGVTSAKNMLFNAGFSIWQRGDSFSAGQEFTADRWRINSDCRMDKVVLSNAGGQGIVGRLGRTGTTGTAATSQPIELDYPGKANRNMYIGETITISIRGYFSAGKSVSIKAHYRTSAGESIGQVIAVPEATVGVGTGNLQTLSLTHTLTLAPVAANSCLEVLFLFDGYNTTTDFAYIVDAQVETGSVANAIEQVSPAEDMSRCMRYYYNGGPDFYPRLAVRYGTNWLARTMHLGWPVPMRVAPTVTLDVFNVLAGYSVNSGVYGMNMDGTVAAATSPTSVNNIRADAEL